MAGKFNFNWLRCDVISELFVQQFGCLMMMVAAFSGETTIKKKKKRKGMQNPGEKDTNHVMLSSQSVPEIGTCWQ